MKKFVSIIVVLLFAFSITAIAFAVENPAETPSKVEKSSPTLGEKKTQSPAMIKKEGKEETKKICKTKKVHKAKKVKSTKKINKAKKPIKKSSEMPSPEEPK